MTDDKRDGDDDRIVEQRVEQQIVQKQTVVEQPAEQPVLRVIGLTGPTGEQGEAGAQGEAGDPGDRQTTLDKWGLAIVVVVTALLALYFVTLAQHKLTDVTQRQAALDADQETFASQVSCTQKLIRTTIVALKARSTFAETQAKVTLQLDRAQQTYLTSIVEPGVDQVAALATYQQALGFKIAATTEQLRIRSLQPFPTLADVEACQK